MNPDSFNAGLVSMHSSNMDGFTHTFNGGTPVVDSSDETLSTLIIELAAEDVIAIQNETAIASIDQNTFISIEIGAISDFSNNFASASDRISIERFGIITDILPAS